MARVGRKFQALGKIRIVELLLAAKATPNHANKDGQTPLMLATMGGIQRS